MHYKSENFKKANPLRKHQRFYIHIYVFLPISTKTTHECLDPEIEEMVQYLNPEIKECIIGPNSRCVKTKEVKML